MGKYSARCSSTALFFPLVKGQRAMPNLISEKLDVDVDWTIKSLPEAESESSENDSNDSETHEEDDDEEDDEEEDEEDDKEEDDKEEDDEEEDEEAKVRNTCTSLFHVLLDSTHTMLMTDCSCSIFVCSLQLPGSAKERQLQLAQAHSQRNLKRGSESLLSSASSQTSQTSSM